jgi:hypothetical protein
MSYKQKACHRRLAPPQNTILDVRNVETLSTCIGPSCMLFCPSLNNQGCPTGDGTCADMVSALSLNQLVMLKSREVTQLEGEPNNGG